MRGSSRIEKLTVVIPCFNEEANIARFEAELLPVLRKINSPWEIVAVDDGSTDQTFARLGEFGSRCPELKIGRHSSNRGLGAALRTGFEAATGDVIVTLDSDFTFHPGQIPLLLAVLTPSVDAVFGSPFLGSMPGVPWLRRILSHGVNMIYFVLLRRRLTSVSSIFRAYRRPTLAKLDLTSTSFDINAEITVKLIKRGAVIKEIPAVLTVRQYGESKIRFTREIANHLKMFWKII